MEVRYFIPVLAISWTTVNALSYQMELIVGNVSMGSAKIVKLPFPKLVSENTGPNDPITFSQFELAETHTKKDKITGEFVKKV